MPVGVSRRGKSREISEKSRSRALENARFFAITDSDLTWLRTAPDCEICNKLTRIDFSVTLKAVSGALFLGGFTPAPARMTSVTV